MLKRTIGVFVGAGLVLALFIFSSAKLDIPPLEHGLYIWLFGMFVSAAILGIVENVAWISKIGSVNSILVFTFWPFVWIGIAGTLIAVLFSYLLNDENGG